MRMRVCVSVSVYTHSKKACKYFDQGRGSCPFGGKCLYLHALPDGRRAEPEQPRKQLSSEGNIRVRTVHDEPLTRTCLLALFNPSFSRLLSS